MKIALVGTGKTGGEVRRLLIHRELAPHLQGIELLKTFGSAEPPTAEALSQADAVIVFVPPHALESILPSLVEARRPTVVGTTGFTWSGSALEAVKSTGKPWILGSNFSLGMNLCFAFARIAAKTLVERNWHAKVHEVHHVHKVDRPSGTAKTWARLFDHEGMETQITDHREGDVKGLHELTLSSQAERIDMRHEVMDRSLFAEGAICAARDWFSGVRRLDPGLHLYEDLFIRQLLENQNLKGKV